MTAGPLSDVVAQQYERWVYPEPIVDLPKWLEHNWQWFDPSHAHRVIWPDRAYREDLDILVAGCGTNQAAVIAFTNPGARVVAIDVSQSSLDHHDFLKEKYDLANLELHRLPIEEVGSLGSQFDLVISTGVLHHLADPAVGMRALGELLRPDGVLAVMLYAKYGRIGVEMLQSVFRDMGLQQDEASLELVKAALKMLPAEHPISSYLPIAPDVNVDGGLVDTFLHGRDASFTIGECISLVEDSGLIFQDVFLKTSYYPPATPANEFSATIAQLPREEQWSVMERVFSRNACHFFLATRPERARASYDIDFSSRDALEYVPSFRYRCGLEGNEIVRSDWRIPLAPFDLALLRNIDGKLTLRQAIANAARSEGFANESLTELEKRGVNLIQSMWQRDFIAIGIVQ